MINRAKTQEAEKGFTKAGELAIAPDLKKYFQATANRRNVLEIQLEKVSATIDTMKKLEDL